MQLVKVLYVIYSDFQFGIEVGSQVDTGLWGMYPDSSRLDIATVVPISDGNDDGYPLPSSSGGETIYDSRDDQSAPSSKETEANGLSFIRKSIQSRNISSRAANIIMAVWRSGTQKQYTSHIKRFSTVVKDKLIIFKRI